MSAYRGNWSCYQDLLDELMQGQWNYATRQHEPRQLPDDFPREDEIRYAGYDIDGYEGSATIVYQRDGILLEWGDGHCSCNGLEWSGATPTTESRLLDLLFDRERP